jgi:hypothetical protein
MEYIIIRVRSFQLAVLCGDVAQLGEYLNGIQGVRGSNPLISTNEIKGRACGAHHQVIINMGTIEAEQRNLYCAFCFAFLSSAG